MNPRGPSLALVLGIIVAPALAQVPNDEWQAAQLVGPGFVVGSNIGATTGVPIGNCGQMGNDVWYRFVAGCTGAATVTLCGSGTAGDYDTVVAAWCSLPCGAKPGLLACNDDVCGVRSQVTFGVVSGRTYYISVGGFFADVGTFTFLLSCAGGIQPPAPPNDTCANAILIADDELVTGTNLGAGLSGTDPYTSCAPLADVWYWFTAANTGPYVATTCLPGTDFDTILEVFAGGCGSAIEVGCNDDSCHISGAATRSTVTFYATAGIPYRIAVGGYNGAVGTFNLGVNFKGAMDFDILTPAPGGLAFTISRGPPGGIYFAAFTGNYGSYPNGWFLGIDISPADLSSQLNVGFPFLGPLDSCGTFTVGPFWGLPAGLTILGAAVGFPPIAGVAPIVSNPDVATVF